MQENITADNKDQLSESAKVVGCSDSSVDPLDGAAAYSWVPTNEAESGRITRTEPTRTSPDNMTSFRGELTGISTFHGELPEKNWEKDANGKVDINLELWCDNKSVLKDKPKSQINLRRTV